jgi:hypothetical protein
VSSQYGNKLGLQRRNLEQAFSEFIKTVEI